MGILDRLGDVIRSYLNDDEGPFGKAGARQGQPGRGDPDYAEAWEELDNYLNERERDAFRDSGGPSAGTSAWRGTQRSRPGASPENGEHGSPPEELRADFAELGLEFGADEESCKTAYKKLLKIHHPDRHAGHPGNMEKATRKSARINAAFDRIEKWRQGNPF